MKRLLLIAPAALAASCGGGDGGTGPGECVISIYATPSEPTTADLVQVVATIDEGIQTGVHQVSWSVSQDGAAVTFEVDASDDEIIVFDPDVAGIYEVTASGAVGGSPCVGDGIDINVRTPGSVDGQYRLRITPLAADVPAQDIDLIIPSGADFSLGTVVAADGVLALGTALGPGDGPLEGYLRASLPTDDLPLLTEAFADAAGEFELALLSEQYELLVVPDSAAVAPERFDVEPGAIDELLLDAGDDVTGTVRDGNGDPVVGARVSLSVGGVPSTVGVTSGAGIYTLRARAGGPVAVTVRPPAGSGLPQLEVDAADGTSVADGSVIDVDYAAGLGEATVAPELRLADGATPAPGARVTWRARPIASAGTVAIDGDDVVARGTAIRTGEAGVGGDVPAMDVPDAIYDVVVEPPMGAAASQGVRQLVVDLDGGVPPAVLALASPARLGGVVVDADGAPVVGARLRAEGRGALSGVAGAGAAAVSDDDGSFELRVAGGGTYEVVVDGAPAGEARVRQEAIAPAAGNLAAMDVAMPRALEVMGTLVKIGDVPVRAHVELLCLDCEVGVAVPVAEALTDATGRFLLLMPDRE